MSKRYRSGQITHYIDVSDVIDEIEDDDLLAEIEARDLGGKIGVASLPGSFTELDVEQVVSAIDEGRAFDLLAIMQACIRPAHKDAALLYASLPRDKETGRPLL